MNIRTLLTIIMACTGIGLMAFYSWCDTSCAYLKGDIFGIDLKYLGIAYMIMIVLLAVGRQMGFIRLLLAGGIGGEVVLVVFQFREDVFCPFCLAFGTLVVMMYLLHYRWGQKESPWYGKLLYLAGMAEIPFIKWRIPLIVVMLLGYLFMSLTFNGSATPSYSASQRFMALAPGVIPETRQAKAIPRPDGIAHKPLRSIAPGRGGLGDQASEA